MLLAAFDVGNSRTHAALFAETSTGFRLVEHRPTVTIPELRRWRGPVATAVWAGVGKDPGIDAAVRRAWGLRAMKMGRDFPAACRNRTRTPSTTGQDRLADAVAYWHRTGRPGLVIDAGTAVTFNIVGPRGGFLGGAIAPGSALLARSLHAGTARLPLVAPRARTAFGRDTRQAIEAGVTWALRGAVREGIASLRRRVRVIATGGDAPRIADLVDEVVPWLTLEGIALSFRAHARR